MDAKGFFQHVVPWNLGGYVTIHWHLPGQNFLGRSVRSIDDALALVAELKATTRHNIYFCISHQSLNSGQRDRAHATGLVCLPMDLDVKPGSDKHYQTVAEALAALFTFCDETGIPRPALVVVTGGGVHAYWLSNRVLTVEEWQPYADGLKHAAIKAGLKFDRQCTGDAARVLRVPGTFNWKYEDGPRPVRLLSRYCTGEKLDFANSLKKILGTPGTSGSTARVRLPPIKIAAAFKAMPVKPLAAGVVNPEIPPLAVGPFWKSAAS